MYLTVHASVGALIGKTVGNNPLLGFVLGFLSHFLLDKIPHADPHISLPEHFGETIRPSKPVVGFITIVLLDSLLVAALTSFLITKNIIPSSSILSIIGSVLPDFAFGFYFLTKNKYLKKFHEFHEKMHFDPKKYPVNKLLGNITQLSVLILSMLLLLIF